ncbi:hypothetical protein [Acrocarpospora corrugata]
MVPKTRREVATVRIMRGDLKVGDHVQHVTAFTEVAPWAG